MSTRIGNQAPQRRPHMEEKFGGDVRGSTIPCPMLSTLINEKLVTPDKNGNVSVAQLQSAFEKIGLSKLQRDVLTHGGANAIEGNAKSPVINMFKLMGSSLDHKGSLGPLQDGGFNQKWLDQLKSCSKDGKTLTLEDLSTAQLMRIKQENGGFRDINLGRAEITALLLVVGRPNAEGKKAISLTDIERIFKDNKLPEHFEKQDVSTLNLLWNMGKMAFMQHTTAAGRAELGLQKALGQQTRLDASSMAGLGAMCPAGMRPKQGMGVNEREVSQLHASLQD